MKQVPRSEDPAGLLIEQAASWRRDLIRSRRSELEDGPPGSGPDPSAVARHRWFRSLAEGDKEMVLDEIRETVDVALWGMLGTLDEPFAVDGRTHEPILYLDIYEDEESLYAYRPSYRTRRVNDPGNRDGLRDRYVDVSSDAEGGGGSQV